MTSYMSKDQGNFDFSCYDPFKSVFLCCCTQKKKYYNVVYACVFSESNKFDFEMGNASGGFTTENEETPSSNGKRVLLLNSTNI